MNRIVLVLVVFVSAAAGTVAQDALKPEDPSVDSVVQVGVLYSGSICEDHRPGYPDFYFRVTRKLDNNWIEAEYGYLRKEYSRSVFKPGRMPMRLNLGRMCSLQVETFAD